MKATCTRHALYRVRERLGLSVQEFIGLLDENKAVDIGTRPGTDHMHRLFYDWISGHYFVAVQDTRNGEVVTVLPLDYHNRCAWQVDQELMTAARELVEPAGPQNTPRTLLETVEPQNTPSTHVPTQPKFLVRVCCTRSGKLVRHRLSSVDPGKYGGDLGALLSDAAFTSSVVAQLLDAGVSSADVDAMLSVRLGQKGDPKVVALWEMIKIQ